MEYSLSFNRTELVQLSHELKCWQACCKSSKNKITVKSDKLNIYIHGYRAWPNGIIFILLIMNKWMLRKLHCSCKLFRMQLNRQYWRASTDQLKQKMSMVKWIADKQTNKRHVKSYFNIQLLFALTHLL